MKISFVALLFLSLAAAPLRAQNLLEDLVARQDSVSLISDQAPKHRAFLLDDPPRLVIELSDTKNGLGPRQVPGEGRWLQSARVSQFQVRPYVTRVVLDLKQAAPYRINSTGAVLKIDLGEPAPAPAAPVKEPFKPALPKPIAREEPASLALSGAQAALLVCAALLIAVFFLVQKAAGPAETPPDFSPENTAEMVEGVQQNLNALARRISILEKKFSQLPPHSASPESPDQKIREELAELKTVVKSLADALQLPKLRGH